MRFHSPILQSGSLLYSTLAFCYRASAARHGRRFVDSFYGYRGASHLNWFGAGAAFVSREIFNDTVLPLEILQRNTLFGFYSLRLSPEAANQWSAELASGRGKGSVRYTKCLDPIANRDGLRWCRQCAAEDEARSEPPTWRPLHQLPFVQHCPEHLEPLVDRCSRCDFPLDDGRRFRLPGERCCECGGQGVSSTSRRPTRGEQRLLKRADEAFRRQVDTYRPANWAGAVSGFLMQYSSSRDAEEALTEQLCALWEVESVANVWSQLGLTVRSKELIQAISISRVSSPLTMQLVVADAMQMLHPHVFDEPRRTTAKQSRTAEESSHELVRRHGAMRDLDPRFMDVLVRSGSRYAAAKAAALSKTAARRAVATLRTSLCEELGQDAGTALFRSVFPRLCSLMASTMPLSLDERVQLCRARLLKLFADEPRIHRKAIWQRLPKEVTFLSRNDKLWLQQAMPLPLNRQAPGSGTVEEIRMRDQSAKD